MNSLKSIRVLVALLATSAGHRAHDDHRLQAVAVEGPQRRIDQIRKGSRVRAVRRFRRAYRPDIAHAMAVETSVASSIRLFPNSRDPLAPGNLGPGGSGSRLKFTRTTLFSRSITQCSMATCRMVSP
jgi:hypothetical protein